MKYKRIVLAGGNGYLGGVLAEYYKYLADDVVILSRKSKPADANIRTVVWNGLDEGEWVGELQGADLLINLCGKNVNCRYTDKTKLKSLSPGLCPQSFWEE